ncbi:S8 family peptidase [Radiobacillus kanasensis]|uniref:S8 family peptidase n=1 Tax=Radiobacillus kanasensis TaxID=2844358 RepID=UPI001E3AB314|nr:S8 family peptidase [Radiobacillus kanasensis]UFU00250.1 S8 family peptidase [Radiobacillus kanasensis]
MFGYSIIQLVRQMGDKIDRDIRQELVQFYQPFRKIPCFLHRPFERVRKKAKRLPIIIEFEDGTFDFGLSDMKSSKCRTRTEFPSISCCSTKLSVEKIEQLLKNSSHIKKIHYDRKVTTLLDVASPSIHSEQLKQSGLTGKDINIAIVDTGIYPHDDLQGRIIGFKDLVNNRTETYDDNGHGTHCAGDAAGNGQSSNGEYQAPAPEANVIGVKVLDKMGSGSLSTVIAGIDWCIQNKSTFNIDVLSLSLGSNATQSAEEDPVVKAVNNAWDNGIVVCVAAGNSGPAPETIASPGISPKIITVGAANDNNTTDRSDDIVAEFSSRGPTIDGLTKPDLLTPGVNIISLRSPRSYIDRTNPQLRVDENYISLSGTSMATPICAGVVAQLLQKQPTLTPDEVKQQLISACEDIGQAPNVQGHGYLDAENLV